MIILLKKSISFTGPIFHVYILLKSGTRAIWWIPNRACVEALLRHAGFDILSHPEEEVFVCSRQERSHGFGAVYPAARDTSQGEDKLGGNR
jgi:hypothetical protein